MNVLETERLRLRPLSADDAPFILELLNEPSWIRFIGDRGVHTLDDARRYIAEGPCAMYALHGLGLMMVETKGERESLGICGLIRRASLPDVDIGFAFLPRFWGKGFAFEAAAATLEHARRDLGLRRILAITSLDNESSIRLLEKLGLRYERTIRMPGEDEDLKLFAVDFPRDAGVAP